MANHLSSSANANEERTDEWIEGGPEPPGYRFVPTHQEIIEHYMMNKILDRPVTVNIITDVDLIHEQDPEDLHINELIDCRKNEGYFFTHTKLKTTDEARRILITKSGYWKISKEEEPVIWNDRLLGYKKTYVFFRGKQPEGEQTYWKMREYRMSPDIIPADALNDSVWSEVEKFVACKIRYKEPVVLQPLPPEESESEESEENEESEESEESEEGSPEKKGGEEE